MRRVIKIGGTVLVVLLAVLLIVPVALKGKVSQIVKQEANKMLTATLDFDELNINLLRHFPNASLNLDGLTLIGGVEPFQGDTIVAADRISVVVNLLSLFSEEGFEVRQVLLDEPYIHGQVAPSGAVNWDVMKPTEEAQEEPSEEVVKSSEEESSSAFRLSLRDVRIQDAHLCYEDDSTRLYASISPLNLNLRGNLSAAYSDLKLKLLAEQIYLRTGDLTLANGLEAEIKADLGADLEQQHFTLNKNTFRLNAIEMMLDGSATLLEEGVDMDLRLNSNKVNFREILSLVPAFYTRDFEDLKAAGELTLEAWAKGRLEGNRMPAFALELGVKEGSFKYASLPQSVTGIRLAAKVENPGEVLDATRVEVSDFGLTMAGNSLRATFSAATPISDLQFKAGAEGKVDLGAIKEVYPLGDSISLAGLVTMNINVAGCLSEITEQRYEEIEASGNLMLEQMQARLTGLPTVDIHRMVATVSPRALTLGECQVGIGRSDLAANGQLTNYLGWLLRDDLLAGRLYLRSNLIDLNELLGAVSEEPTEQEAEPEEQTPAEAEPIQAPTIPTNLNLSLETNLKKVLFQQMTIQDFTGQITVKEGKAELSKLAMQALGGRISASGSYAATTQKPEPYLSLQAKVEKASFERTFQELELVQKMVPLFEKTGGDYSMSMRLQTQMTADMGINYSTLNATGEISSSNIQLSNVPIFNSLTSALKADKIQNSLAGELVVIHFTIADGRLSTKPFDLKLGSTRMTISGSTGLDQTIDYTARVALPGKAASLVQEFDVKIGGTFTAPKFSIDTAEVAKQAATNLINEQVEKLTGSETLDAEIQKQAEQLREEARKAGERLVAEAEKQKEALIAKAGNNALAKLAAEKTGEALVKEAEKQAANLVEKAEAEITKLEQRATGNQE